MRAPPPIYAGGLLRAIRAGCIFQWSQFVLSSARGSPYHQAQGGYSMTLISNRCPTSSRREMLKVAALAAIPLMPPSAVRGFLNQEPIAANGSADPYPIPWLDKNGSHNQPAGPNLEPSHIYHFKGKVARCSTFTGMGTDSQGNRIPFGSPTTDYGVMSGDYWAARTTQQATYTHI